jgi:hypothetical protein
MRKNVMVDDIEDDLGPNYKPVRSISGSGWDVEITYPNGRVQRRPGFKSDSEANDWIIENSGKRF